MTLMSRIEAAVSGAIVAASVIFLRPASYGASSLESPWAG